MAKNIWLTKYFMKQIFWHHLKFCQNLLTSFPFTLSSRCSFTFCHDFLLVKFKRKNFLPGIFGLLHVKGIMLKVNSKLACGNKNLKAHFSAILGFFVFVSKQQSKLYKNEKQYHLMEDMEGEKNVKKSRRYKVQCGFCKKSSDKDYRSNHN